MISPQQPQRWGILGAESSGKTRLAGAIAQELNQRGRPAVVVSEFLRQWCATHNRLPSASDQMEILAGQLAAEDRAAQKHPGSILVCDPAAITTALYSILYFQDYSPLDLSVRDLKVLDRYQELTWCDIDIPWEFDPLRDGPHRRRQMHELIRSTLHDYAPHVGREITPVSGDLAQRVEKAFGRRGNPFAE